MAHYLRRTEDHETMSRAAAEQIVVAIECQPNLLLCAAGGSTPLRAYELLAAHRARQPDLFQSLRLIKLDEWGGLKEDDPGTCEKQLRSLLIDPLGISRDRYLGFRGAAPNSEAECERMRGQLASEGPIDLCILGLGVNGHVAMNEPGPFLKPLAHVAHLTEISLRHPMLADSKTLPSHGLTLGMAEILHSAQILLLVSGANKRAPLERLLKREISTDFPASFLWLHQNWTLYCDRAASEGINLL